MSEYMPPKIAPPRKLGPRPFWSVMIPVYNRTTYLERTLRSVLSQDPGAEEMQIEVVDDASTEGDPETMIRRIGGDRVNFFCQPRNLGIIANWNDCVERSVGEWVHILHSDDVVFPGFYARLKAAMELRDDVGVAFCRHAFIDENERWMWTSDIETPTAGILPGFIEKLGVLPRIQCASIVVRRSVYEKLGGFRADLSAADWEMWQRIASQYPVWYEPAILAAMRLHSGSYTTALMRSAGNIADARRCIEISHSLLPPDRADTISRKAREYMSLAALDTALFYLSRGEFRAALHQSREGVKCGVSLALARAVFFLPLRIAKSGIRRAYATGKRRSAGEES
jgi:glycosyltransferase involved in cell wall biosynthesis